MNIIFFGSTEDSVIVAKALRGTYPIVACVTQPEKPVGRKHTITKTPLEHFAEEGKIPCLMFAADEEHGWKYKNEDDVINTLATFKPDLFVTACYGQKLPKGALTIPQRGALNIHPSLLPRWRGADPVPWTIIAGDTQTGVTISTITDTFDSGDIVCQKKIAVTEKDFPDELRTHLFTLGAHLLLEILPEYLKGSMKAIPQKQENVVVARKLTRDDGYVPWELLQSAMKGEDVPRENRSGILQKIQESLIPAILKLHRALTSWPGIWTKISISGVEKRVKILSFCLKENQLYIEHIQLEGKNPVDWNTFKKAYIA